MQNAHTSGFNILIGIPAGFAVMMLIPASYAFLWESAEQGRAFLYSALLIFFVLVFIDLARRNAPRVIDTARSQLITLIIVFTLFPLVLAVPFYEALQNTSFINAYLEMVSALSTTGFPVFSQERLSTALHLWRALVAWGGGLIIWVIAWSILAPLNLGGYEHLSRGNAQIMIGTIQSSKTEKVDFRVWSELGRLAPIYVLLTGAAFTMLLASNIPPEDAAIYAMGVLSTSGIIPPGDGSVLNTGIFSEAIIAIFMCFGLSRSLINKVAGAKAVGALQNDQEIRLAALLVAMVAMIFFIHHFVAASVAVTSVKESSWLLAIWGGAFTALSFLTTTGYVSEGWNIAQDWSGLRGASLLLLGLALIGGGIATTAGGIKLLRVSLLIGHSKTELLKLASPSQVLPTRKTTMSATVLAWVFFMVFAVSLASIFILIAFTGTNFEDSLVLTVASLSNTGPLSAVAGKNAVDFLALSDASKLVLCFAMVLGRLETFVFISLLNPDLWR